jgi:hypothetical protein
MRRLKRALLGLAAVVGVAGVILAVFVLVECSRFDTSLDKVYDVPVPTVTRSTDPTVLARGKHLVESIAACASADCHGADLGGGRPIEMGPLGTLTGPNITIVRIAYSDGELARLIQHGIKKDGRGVRLMPSQDFGWLPDVDVAAIVSYLRTVPEVDRPNGSTVIEPLAKALDRLDMAPLDVARRIDHAKVESVPAPAPTATYGAFLARDCRGCHGERHYAGGRIPGTPDKVPAPLNLTPDPTGLQAWTFEDFDRAMRTGVLKGGKMLDPFMPVDAWRNLDDVEMHALWAYLQSLPPVRFGER